MRHSDTKPLCLAEFPASLKHMVSVTLKTLFFCYLGIVLGIGCFSARGNHTPDDYYIAGRRAGALSLTGSLLATILGSSAILGSIDFAYARGWAGAWFMLCGALGLFLLLFFVKPIASFRGYHLPMLLGRFYGDGVRKLSAGVIAIAWLGVIGAQLIGAAKITSTMCGIPYNWAVLAVGLSMTFYTAAGGQLSIIRTDLLQAALIFLGILPLAGTLFFRSPSLEAAPMISPAFGYSDLLAMIFAYSSTYLVGPDIYSRLFCAKDTATAKQALVATGTLLIPTAFLLAFIGIYGARLYQRGGDSILFAIAKGEFHPAFSLLLYFSMLSAILSSADTTLFTAGSLLSQFFVDRMDTQRSVRLTMGCIAALGLLAILIALRFTSILTVLLFALAVYAGAFVVPVLWGLLGKQSSRAYAVAAILTGGALSLTGKLIGGKTGNLLAIVAFAANLLILCLGNRKT